MKKIKELITDCLLDIDIKGITDDSRKVKEGYLFVATKGYNVDHFDFVDDAISNGAAFLITDREIKKEFPYKMVKNINQYYLELCQKFYDIDLNDFNFIGITGTDGKTTTTSIINQLLDCSAYIGTNGVTIGKLNYQTNNTTPCISELYEILNFIKKSGCVNVVMEVSSEALLHKRLENFNFDFVGFTNITEDHLNIHKTIENYRKCKFSLLNHLKNEGICFFNGDCPNCRLISCEKKCSYGFNDDNDYVIKNVKFESNLTFFELHHENKIYKIHSPLIGNYNIYNVTLAFLVCLYKGISCEYLIEKIKKLEVIKGRREFLCFGQDFDVILDYAHTYNGIKNILDSVSNYKKIIVVTGAAGGREKEKRPLIGKLILDKASIAIFTMDDPRYEKVRDIINDMIGNDKRKCYKIVDRKKAIKKAFSLADRDTVVLILGKGRDEYMAIKDKKEYYSDYDVIKELLEKGNKF